MKSNPLVHLIYVLIEIIWLTPFLIASACLASSQHENGLESQVYSRLQAANLFVLTAVAARVIALSFRNAAPVDFPALDTVAVLMALMAGAFQLSGRLADEDGSHVRRGFRYLLVVTMTVMLSTALLAVASPVLKELKVVIKWGRSDVNVRKRVLKATSGSPHHPVSSDDTRWLEPSTPVSAIAPPQKIAKLKPEHVKPEPIPIISEYPDVVPGDLLPKSTDSMDVSALPSSNNAVSASVAPLGLAGDAAFGGIVTVTALDSAHTAAAFFGRQPDALTVNIGGQTVTAIGSPGQLRATWTKARFAFEIQVNWSEDVDANVPLDFLRHIIQATVAATRGKVK